MFPNDFLFNFRNCAMEFSKAVVYFLSAKVFEIVPLKDCPEWSSKKMTELKNGDTVTLQIERDYVPASAIVIQIGREEDNLLVTLQHAHELKKKKKFSVEKIKKIIKPLHPKGRQHLPNIDVSLGIPFFLHFNPCSNFVDNLKSNIPSDVP